MLAFGDGDEYAQLVEGHDAPSRGLILHAALHGEHRHRQTEAGDEYPCRSTERQRTEAFRLQFANVGFEAHGAKRHGKHECGDIGGMSVPLAGQRKHAVEADHNRKPKANQGMALLWCAAPLPARRSQKKASSSTTGASIKTRVSLTMVPKCPADC